MTQERDLRSLNRRSMYSIFAPLDADERLPRELLMEARRAKQLGRRELAQRGNSVVGLERYARLRRIGCRAGVPRPARIAGTVGSVAFSAGGSASPTAVIAIVGGWATSGTVDIPMTTVPRVKKGQQVEVTAAGATSAVAGTQIASAEGRTNVTEPVRQAISAPTLWPRGG